MFAIIDRFLFEAFRRHQRKLDLEILWPAIKKSANSLDEARMAFAAHMDLDPAYAKWSTEEKFNYARNLQ